MTPSEPPTPSPDPLAHIARLHLGAQLDLLRVLTSPAHLSVDLIRQTHQRSDTHELAEVLMGLEADELIRSRSSTSSNRAHRSLRRPVVTSSPPSDLLHGTLPCPTG
jgi:hypothetical protein